MNRSGPDRGTEYTKWAASRPGVPNSASRRRFVFAPLQRPIFTFLGILAFALVVVGGGYAMFGAGGPALSADHDAVAATIDLNASICCIEYQEIDDEPYLFTVVLEPQGFIRDSRPPDISLRVISLGDGEMSEIASIDAPIESFLPRTMAMIDATMFVPLGISRSDDRGIWTVDVSDPANPAHVGFKPGGPFVTGVATDDDDLLVAHSQGTFHFFDASADGELAALGEFDQPVSAVHRLIIDRERQRMYYREVRSNQIHISNISDPVAVEPLGNLQNADRMGRYQAVRADEIDSPEDRLEATAPAGHYQDFALYEETLYVAAGDLGLEIVDVSDATSPDTLDRIQLDGRAVRTEIAEESLYVVTVSAESRDRLGYQIHSFDLGDPSQPELTATIDDIRAAPGRQAIETGGGYVFLGLHDSIVMLEPDR